MKTILQIMVLFLFGSTFAQQGINYKAIVKDGSGNVVANDLIQVQFTILQGATSVYQETHSPTTDANGIVIINIGEGIPISGTFSTIDWSADDHYLNVQINTGGGLTDMGTTQFMAVPYAMHAQTAESVSGVTTYSVGDFAHGGIVFWVDETGQHGLVCAKQDQSTGVRWYAGTNGNTQARGDGPYAGKANTSIIIAAQVAIGDDGNTYAARICNELLITENGKYYGDWYLPSKYELNLIYQNMVSIDTTAIANGGSLLGYALYWSSTESSSSDTWYQDFGDGSQLSAGRLNTLRVRAIRAF
ncbi:Lcl domain-containing protein [Xanthomarina gelatinilytica]|uniref:Lcl domain-containing protein n=1 Tax=Xanthomarina gelatinilytica TaxID=1137281 RepID=UPI0035193350